MAVASQFAEASADEVRNRRDRRPSRRWHFRPPVEEGGIGPDLFGPACEFLTWALVSEHVKRADNHWFKVKQPKQPAYERGASAHD